MRKILTLCPIIKGNKILLGLKKRGFGAGRFNGFGGKVEPSEKIEEAVVREIKEECGVDALEIIKMGIIEFSWEGKEEILEVHIYKCEKYSGEPVETEEMRPEWFDFKDIPYEKMWSDDIYWLPMFLEGKKFRGKFEFDENDKVVKNELNELEIS